MGLLSKRRETGISLINFIFLLGLGGAIGVLGLKVVPTVSEYIAIKKAITKAKDLGSSAIEIRQAFDRQANAAYITSIAGKDLVLVPRGASYDVSFSYQKVIPLFGPASLLLEYEGTTAATLVQKQAY